MQFKSTRNSSISITSAEAIKQGLSVEGGLFVPETIPEMTEYLKKTNLIQKNITKKSVGSFGYGDGGGGVTIGQIERSKRFENMPGMPKAENTFVADFFRGTEEFKDEIPTFNDELVYENHRGTFTSQAFIKKNNRRGEFLFRNAPASTE